MGTPVRHQADVPDARQPLPRSSVPLEQYSAAPRPSAGRPGYLPTLDGWRALAISIVLLSHAPTVHFGLISTARFHNYGYYGVVLFFSISGLLICTRLLNEEEATGKLQLKSFYIRRLFRIQPVALSCLLCLACLVLLHRLQLSPASWLAALLLVRNYAGIGENPRCWPTAHYWSLSVEEHFYLILPALLVLVRRWRARLLLGLAALDGCWFLYELSRAAPDDRINVSIRTDTCICLLLLPAGLAVLLRRDRFRQFATKYVHAVVIAPLALLAIPHRSPLMPLLLILPSLLVLSTLLHPGSLFGRFLELAPLRFVGRISYSLYLWQQLFMTALFPGLHPFGWLNFSLLQWPVLFAVATVSYYCIEKPFIRAGHRLARSSDSALPATTGSAPASS